GADGAWPSPGVSVGQGISAARPYCTGVAPPREAEQPVLSDGTADGGDWHHPRALCGLRADACGREARGPARHPSRRETIRQWMMAAGLWKDRRQRMRPVHQPRYRRDCVGELIQIDGSRHWWFETRGPQCTLLVYIDDATSRLMHLQFVE